MIDARFYKKPGAGRDFYLDWSDYSEFSEVPPQTIAGAVITSVTGLTFSSVLVAGTNTYWTTTGGVAAGRAYVTTVTVTTSAGKTLTADVAFNIY